MHNHYYRCKPGMIPGNPRTVWNIEIVLERFHEEQWMGPFKPAIVHRFFNQLHASEWMAELNKARGTNYETTLRDILRIYREESCVS